MITDTPIKYTFRQSPHKGLSEKIIDAAQEKADDETDRDRGHILCRQCLFRITKESERIHIDNSHQHVFANPHGIVFEIGCFQTAEGCRYMGPPTTEYSWFKGFSWEIAVCRACQNHLGWFFTSATSGFYGLILNRLVMTG